MFSREVSWTFYFKMGEIPLAASQKLQEKIPESSKYGAL